ncbi:MAG: dephospho-CoA kinase [Bacteroidales bacterium]|nr:dephospho-CoA kinase [Bacteroidales bacterium]
MIRVGLTGGIGSGKTTVLKEFERLCIPVFSADTVAASYYQDYDFLKQLCGLLGNSIINADGTANKQQIAAKVFNDSTLLDKLTALIHPKVMSDFDLFCKQNTSARYVVFESAILYEYGYDKMMDCVVAVYLSRDERITRTVLRDSSTRQQVEQRIKNQMPAEETLYKADYIVLNYEGNPRARQVKYINSQILARS